jgi:menaquinone-dependent protoporphyrinogen oxidase
MATIFVCYGTTEGHAGTIVERLRATLAARGHEVVVERAGKVPPEIPEAADGVIVGASVHRGQHQREIEAFVEANRARLESLPSAFFQVCLTAADPTPEAMEATSRLIDEFQAETGWRPAVTETFAGMLAWTQYDVFTRTIMRLILRKQHLPPEQLDRSHDVDYTDYEAVEAFGKRFAELVESAA